jgi:dTDP-4-amino-4,6-dideoxygalactose transaminase
MRARLRQALLEAYLTLTGGTISGVTVFSLYSTANLTSAEGGLVTIAFDAFGEDVRIKGLHGVFSDAWKRYSDQGVQPHEVLSWKSNVTDLQAAVGLHQSARFEESLKKPEPWWKMYNSAFSDMNLLTLSPDGLEPGSRHDKHLCTVLLDTDRLLISRWEFMKELRHEGIGASVHCVALHLRSFYKRTLGYKLGDFPNVEFISDRPVSLPLSPKLTERNIYDVITAVKKVLGRWASRSRASLRAPVASAAMFGAE